MTGAVYNAQNLPPLSLPGEASRSVLRTESIGGSGGFNELSFEDASGKEEIYLHAQRNLRERVLNDHTTHVGHDHTNTVDNDDTELVKGNQELTVKKDRTKTVKGDETITIGKNRKTTVGVDDTLHVKNDSHTTIDNDKTLDVLGNYDAKVIGAQTWTIDGGSTLTVTGGITQTINSGGWTMTTTGKVSHSITGSMSINTSAGFSVDATADVSLTGQNIVLNAANQIQRTAPGGIVNLTPTREHSIASERSTESAEAKENHLMKFEYLGMIVAIIGAKIEYTHMKADFHKMEFGNHDLQVALSKIGLSSGTFRLLRADATII